MNIQLLDINDTFEEANVKINRNLVQFNASAELLPERVRRPYPAGSMSMVDYLRYVDKVLRNNSALIGFPYSAVGIPEVMSISCNGMIEAVYGQMNDYFKSLLENPDE